MVQSKQEESRLLSDKPKEDVEAPQDTGSDEDSGFEDEAELKAHKTSQELRRHDQGLLDEEEERERILISDAGNNTGGLGRLFGGKADKARIGRRDRRKYKREARRDRRNRRRGEDSELMYEMEEGGRSSGSGSSRDSSESDQQRLRTLLAGKHRSGGTRFKRAMIYVSIVILFFVLLFAAYKASSGRRPTRKAIAMLSNGTSNFAPTTILISLDGFRADFLDRGLTPTLNSMISMGISPKYMLPSFPSVTFPNHYTMVTGLYPESHGVVGNSFWDPALQEEFYYTDPARSMQNKWWGGDPLWSTAESQGIRTAIHMWPGSEAHIGEFEPAYIDKYNGSERLDRKVDRMLGLLDLPGPESPSAMTDEPRPQLIAVYVPNVDADGHNYGPNSTEIRKTINDVDTMLFELFTGLQDRNLTGIVNVVIVSDHGMATTDITRMIQLEDLVDTDLIEHIDGWPLYGLRPKNPDDLERLYDTLQEKAQNNANIEVYLRDKDMPERYHFSNNDRIAPLWIVPKTGWAIVTKEEFDIEKSVANGDVYHPRGLHGYDFENPLMRAIFVARGPAFPHAPGSKMEPFQNTELYNIVCDSIGADPKPNNGTLRLPLKPVGLHSDDDAEPSELPEDPPTSGPATSSVVSSSATSTVLGAESEAPTSIAMSVAPSNINVSPTSTTTNTSPSAETGSPNEDGSENDDEKSKSAKWWEWFVDKVNEAKTWAADAAGKVGDKVNKKLGHESGN
ncbi:nucleotide pyrophosphatase family protein [Saccharata proteae CBS 121410]|uniref:Nucleotide pyrophosphatase family protein n=1 Tax=Saccharata proteae CBS 121410 TaxID=1314787 RepID=A0A9P4LXY8_9PEZI|nr:nucleotide pyrophosphatase family protein [Saccharata proteae CBS 121410]